MELIRRLLFILLLLAGVWSWLELRPTVISVSVEDFARSKQEAGERATGFLYRDKTLEEFYRQRTEDRITRIDDAEWASFHAKVTEATMDLGDGGELRSRRGLDAYDEYLYYLPDEEPVSLFVDSLGKGAPLLYVQIGGEGPAAPTLCLVSLSGADAKGAAPDELLYPRRSRALWLVLAGLACYLFLPRHEKVPGALRYASGPAIVVPDFLAAGLFAFFFGLPMLIATMNGGSLFDFDAGWWVVGAVCWFMCLAPLAILIVTTRNAAFQLHLSEDALELWRLSGLLRMPYSDIERVDAIEWRTPGWLKLLAGCLVLFTWRGSLPALMLGQGQGDGLELSLRGGGKVRLWISSLEGWERVVARLGAAGVVVAEEVRELVAQSAP